MKSTILNFYARIVEWIKKYALFLIKIFVGFGLIIYFINKISFKNIIDSLYTINPAYIFIAIALSLLNILIQYVRWKILIKNESPEIDNMSILKSLLIGISAGTFTPAKLGEYFLRKLTLKNIDLTSVITLTFIDKMMLLINVVFWGALMSFGLMIYFYNVDFYVTASLFIIFITFFTTLFLIIYSKGFYNYFKNLKNKFNFKLKFIKMFISPLSELNNQIISKLMLIAFLNYLIIVLQFSFIVLSFGVQTNFALLMVAAVMVYYTKTIIPPVTLGEIGIREGAAIYFFGIFGCNEAIAFNSAMLLFVFNLLLPSIVGFYYLLRFKRA